MLRPAPKIRLGTSLRQRGMSGGLACLVALCSAPAAAAQPAPSALVPTPPAAANSGPGYADLADLADRAQSVLRIKVRNAVAVDSARTAGLRLGHARLYVEARTVALLAGPPLAGDSLRYLVDVPLDAKGRPPKLGKAEVIVFARTIPGRPGELQLVAPDAQIAWDAAGESRIKAILGELLAPNAPARIINVREAIYVPGTLAGEGETQLFLATENQQPASITVVHRPGESPQWSVSFSEVLDSRGTPPPRDSLTWYRLACFLPARLAPQAHVSANAADRAQAEADYALVRSGLGECGRTRS